MAVLHVFVYNLIHVCDAYIVATIPTKITWTYPPHCYCIAARFATSDDFFTLTVFDQLAECDRAMVTGCDCCAVELIGEQLTGLRQDLTENVSI
jgi:hypothetical protein